MVSLDVADIDFTNEGAIVTLRHSKTDQEGQGTKMGIPYGSNFFTCPVRALKTRLEAAGICEGPLLRGVIRHSQVQRRRLTDQVVAIVVKWTTGTAGLNVAAYSGHSLRAGITTAAATAGVSERAIIAQTNRRNVNMASRYIRDGSLFRENAVTGVGL